MASFRAAREDEDEHLACIFYNAFLHVWDANWMQALSEPLPDARIQPGDSDSTSLTPSQSARISFYRALIKLTRLLSGAVTVAVPSSSPLNPKPQPSAALLWLPPHIRPSLVPLFQSGFLSVIFLKYGLKAVWHLLNYERDLEKLNTSVLCPLGYDRAACGFAFLIATDPAFRGQGYAAKLLKWQIERHIEKFPGVPVVLDTSTDQAQKVYEGLGFRLLGKKALDIRADYDGIALKTTERNGAPANEFSQRVLILQQ